MMSSLRDQLIAQRHSLSVQLCDQLEAAERAGRQRLNASEERAAHDIKALTTRIEHLDSESRRAGEPNFLARLGGDPSTRNSPMKFDDRRFTYRKHGSTSFFRDLTLSSVNEDPTGECRNRLRQHMEELRNDPAFSDRPEYRDLSRTPGDGGFFSPPLWAIDEYIEYARAGRPFADLLSLHPLPAGVSSINVPKILTGTATAIQPSDNQQVTELDLTDTFVTCSVRTIAGQQSVSLQLIDQTPVDFDSIVVNDLAAAHAQNVDVQCLYGTGTSGQLQGVAYWPGITSIAASDTTIQGLYSAIANAYQSIWTTRFAAPTAVVMHPRRWAFLLQSLDEQSRPLFVPYAQQPMNAAGIMANVEPQGLVGTVMGLPIYIDANITTSSTAGTGIGTDDVIYVLRASDVVLYSSGVRARVMPEPLAQTLTVLIQLYSYEALAVRYASSIVEISGLTAPSF
jgi:HK97 family phage major capsid protein